jgi:MSHA biogenesis protein MshG
MARFNYKARDAQGRPLQGRLDAVSPDAAAARLVEGGMTPLTIDEAPAQSDALESARRRLGLGLPGLSDLILFTRQVYALTKAGVPINRGFSRLAESARNRQLGEAVEQIVDDLDSGRELAGAMARHPRIFNALYVNMVRVGEETGRLEEAFLRLYHYLEREIETVNQVKTAIRYPIVVLVVMALAIAVITIKVIPEFAKIYDRFSVELPLPSRVLIGFSEFMAANWWLLLAGLVAGIIAWRRYLATERGRLWWDGKKLQLPIVGSIVLRATLARFSRAFGMASRSGVPITQALTVCSRAVANEYVATKIIGMRNGIERGESLTRTAANTEVFTPLVLQMVAVGEETGQVDDMLDEVAEFYEREVDYDVKHLNDLIQPVLTIALGVLVLILALGVFLPMWDMVQFARPAGG